MKNTPLNLLIENSDKIEILTENTAEGKNLYIEGVFAQAEIINGNKRFYSKGIMESSLNDYVSEYVSRRRALGELNHPDYPFADPDKAAIRVTEMYMQGNDVVGKALVLNTPKGLTVKGLLEGGFAMGVSTRALGSLKEQGGIKHVQKDLMFTALDCVDNPSAPKAYVNALSESQKWMISESTGVWVPVIDKSESDYINEQLFLEKLDNFIKGYGK